MLFRRLILLLGLLLLIAANAVAQSDTTFPVLIYLDPYTGNPNLSGLSTQYARMESLGVTHILGWGDRNAVDSANRYHMKVIALNQAIRGDSTYHNNCQPCPCNAPGCVNDFATRMVVISDSCPQFFERFADQGYTTDFEVEERVINNNKGYAFRERNSSSVRLDTGYFSQASNPNHQAGYMFLGPVDCDESYFGRQRLSSC